MHDSNYHQLEDLFVELCDAKLQDSNKTNSPLPPFSPLSLSEHSTNSMTGVTTGSGGGGSGGQNTNQQQQENKLQEFWCFVGQEVSFLEFDGSLKMKQYLTLFSLFLFVFSFSFRW
jgi:hypothetical protein